MSRCKLWPFLFVIAVLVSGCAAKSSLRRPLGAVPPPSDPSFETTMASLLGTTFLGGNRLATFENGDEIFPAMLAAIRAARKTITFETFVFTKGEIPQQFVHAFVERARAGVKVHVILDAYGGRKARHYYSTLRDAGVELERYHHLWYLDFRRFNHRTHRKLLVVDGTVGFIGGVGIADEWSGSGSSAKQWRDCHYKVEGPAVTQLQGAFAENWLRTHHSLLLGSDYFPALTNAGNISASAFYSSPRRGRLAVPIMYEIALASARDSIRMENPYFIPDHRAMTALKAAARRGVKVQLILPSRHTDSKMIRRASKKRWHELIEAGVEIYEFSPAMLHTKLLIVDDVFVSIGSANFDARSLALNDEANLNVLDTGFAAEQKQMFARDLAKSVRVTLRNLRKKSLIDLPAELIEKPLERQL